MSERNRFFSLILIMILICLSVTGVSMQILYQTALDEERERLSESTHSQARLIEAVARFDGLYSKNYPNGPVQATLSQVRDAHRHYKGFGQTGEFTLARREGNQIVFLLNHRNYDLKNPKPVSFDSKLAEPMKLALSGKSGTVIDRDYRGESVLAAHEPVGELGLGIVAKIDLAEIRAPFARAALIVTGITILFVLIGAVLFLKISNPIIRRLADHNEELNLKNRQLAQEVRARELSEDAGQKEKEKLIVTLQSIGDGVITTDTSGRVVLTNRVAENLTGWQQAEAAGKSLPEVFHIVNEETRKKVENPVERVLREGAVVGLANHTVLIARDGREIPIADSGAPITDQRNEVIGAGNKDWC